MAIYEFFCPNCRYVFEVMRPMNKAGDPAACPKCKRQSQRLPSLFASTAGFSIKVPDKQPFRRPAKKR